MSKISASVGMHNRKQCYNVVQDQETIRDLLNAIPASAGGQEGALSGPIFWGIVSHSLHEAILNFQRWNHLSVDGHIDPNGNALKTMDRILSGGSGPGAGPGSGTSEVAPSVPTATPLPVCGPLRTVARGSLLPALIDVMGGPSGVIVFTELLGLITIEAKRTSPARATDLFTVSPSSPVGMSSRTVTPPPVRWSIQMTAKSTIVGAVKWEFRTDWSPGDPPCDPSL